MTDRTTKILLAAIALGLWVNVATSLVRPALADMDYTMYLQQIQNNLTAIANGVCVNHKLCGY